MLDNAARLLDRCDQLAELSALDDGVLRAYLTAQHKAANALVSEWMQQAGMSSWQDQAGNVWGRLASTNPNAKRLIIGSHLDTVPYAGKYDGILGVLAGIELVESLVKQSIELPFDIDVVGFADEEGVRFGKTLLGSEAISGGWQSEWTQLADRDGVTMSQAFEQFGLNPDQVSNAKIDAEQLLGYWELHIEQGPVLEQHNLPVGVVTGIAGARRFNITVSGHAGHAGTVPMGLRQDALVAAAEMIQSIESLAIDNEIVATVGQINVKPGGVNVIAGEAVFSLDIRSEDDSLRDRVIDSIQHVSKQIAEKRNVAVVFDQTHSAGAVLCDPSFMQVMADACQQVTNSSFHLVSGAGHDAMAVANLCKVAMLFMRCDKGISHHPDEAVNLNDTAIALQVMQSALLSLRH